MSFRQFCQYSLIYHFSKYILFWLSPTDFTKNWPLDMNYIWLELSQFFKNVFGGNMLNFTWRMFFLTPKTLALKIALYWDQYLSMNKLLNLLLLRNLSPSVVFLLTSFSGIEDLIWISWDMNIMGIVVQLETLEFVCKIYIVLLLLIHLFR